jgi:hypothetical protein
VSARTASPRHKHRFWRKCRIYFRHFRIGVWLIVAVLLGAIIYLDRVGLPDFAKRPLLEQLHSRGVDLDFSRLRLILYRGIVADEVRFGRANETNGPSLLAREVVVHLDLGELARLRLRVDRLDLRHGRLKWPNEGENAGLQNLDVEDIQTTVTLRNDDDLSLDNLQARFAGARFFLSASVTNATAIRDWKLPRSKGPATPNKWAARIRTFARTAEKISFSSPPEIHFTVNGDARDPKTFSGFLTMDARNPSTPWGAAGDTTVAARLVCDENGRQSATLDLKSTMVEPRLGKVSGTMGDIEVGLRLVQSTDGQPLMTLDLRSSAVQTRWGNGQDVHVAATVRVSTNGLSADPSLDRWTNALPWEADWHCQLGRLTSEKVSGENLALGGHWRAPELIVTNINAALGGGTFNANAALDILSREATFSVTSDVDPRAVELLLTPRTRRWMSNYTWGVSPHLRASGAITLPAWTNRQPDWRGEVRPTIRLAGEFAATNGAFRGVSADWARSHFTYTNMNWHLPDLEVGRPEGVLALVHKMDDRTKDYEWRLKGTIQPSALRPLLKEKQLRGFDMFSFTQPPVVEGDIWGRLYEYDRIGFQGVVWATNFSVRGQEVGTFHSSVYYTNRVMEFFTPELTRGAQLMNAAGVTADFNQERIFFTNGFSMTEPMDVAKAIGPKTALMMEPYRFLVPPVVKVNGYAPMKAGNTNADMHFVVDGGPFEWSKFKVPRIGGDAYWRNQTLLLTNVQMDFYGGQGAGHAFFSFQQDEKGCDFDFSLSVSGVNLKTLIADLATTSNRLEGVLSGSLLVSDATSTNWNSWQGLGNVRLRDGFIWDIPVFGVLSPALNNLFPGLGSSPVTEGRAGFVITNSVIYSDSLNLRSPTMRLQYEGTVDFERRVDARVEANLLRDAWLVGPILSAALGPVAKLLEYKITGTLSEPKAETVYFPKFLFLPLRPIKMIEGLFQGDSKTNAPPVFKQE